MELISTVPAAPGMYRLQEAGDNDGSYTVAELVVMWVTFSDNAGVVHVQGLSVIEVGRPLTLAKPSLCEYTTKLPVNTRLQIIR